MNLEQKNYKRPTRTQLRDTRFHREELNLKFKAVLEDLNNISVSQKSPQLHIDPTEHINALKGAETKIFSPVPVEFKPKKRAKKNEGVQSRVKAAVNWSENDSKRGSANGEQKNVHESIVTKKAPLALSWEAQQILHPEKVKPNTSTSVYVGLFSKNSALNSGIEQGPVPAIYKPADGNPRARTAKKLQAIKDKVLVGDAKRKAQILQPKERPAMAPVPKTFVPTCGSAAPNPKGKEKRAAVETKVNADHEKVIGDKPFR